MMNEIKKITAIFDSIGVLGLNPPTGIIILFFKPVGEYIDSSNLYKFQKIVVSGRGVFRLHKLSL
jgi:hypothetical protein